MKQFLLSLVVIFGIIIPTPTEAQESWEDLFQVSLVMLLIGVGEETLAYQLLRLLADILVGVDMLDFTLMLDILFMELKLNGYV